MNKTLAVLLISLHSFSSFAQDLTTAKGAVVLPESKDWSVGMQAEPLLLYAGNLFNKDRNESSSLKSQVLLMISGQYVQDRHTAYRLKVRIGLQSESFNNYIDNDEYTGPQPKAKLTDTWRQTSTHLGVGVGLKKSRGKGRLQGIYGVEIGAGFTGATDSYSYGNSFATDNPMPTSTTDWFTTDSLGSFLFGPVSSRTSKINHPKQFDVTLHGFVGVEYFFAAKASLSCEYGWGIEFSTYGEQETFRVSDDGNDGKETSTKSGKESSLKLDVKNSASVTLSFYF